MGRFRVDGDDHVAAIPRPNHAEAGLWEIEGMGILVSEIQDMYMYVCIYVLRTVDCLCVMRRARRGCWARGK
jgi:hypothetical protein